MYECRFPTIPSFAESSPESQTGCTAGTASRRRRRGRAPKAVILTKHPGAPSAHWTADQSPRRPRDDSYDPGAGGRNYAGGTTEFTRRSLWARAHPCAPRCRRLRPRSAMRSCGAAVGTNVAGWGGFRDRLGNGRRLRAAAIGARSKVTQPFYHENENENENRESFVHRRRTFPGSHPYPESPGW